MSQTTELLEFARNQRKLAGHMETILSRACSLLCEVRDIEAELEFREAHDGAHHLLTQCQKTLERALAGRKLSALETMRQYYELALKHDAALDSYYEQASMPQMEEA